jgi:hypothetical protein
MNAPLAWLSVALALGMATTARSQDASWAQGLRLTFSVQVTTEVVPNADPTCPLRVVIEGTGLTDLLGAVHDIASHCVGPDGLAENGRFTFTGATLVGPPGGGDSEDSISGQYIAHIVPTAQSVIPTTPSSSPGGYWLVYEEFCISQGTGKYARIANDCPTPTSAGRFYAARGSIDFDTGQANIYGSARVHLASE